MITCPKCNSMNVRVNSGNFARVKREGEPAYKHTYDIRFFYCEDCENKWETTPESQRDYYDYVALRDRTMFFANGMGNDGSYGPTNNIDSVDLMRKTELARKIVASYRHLLDLDPAEWYELEQDVA